MIHALFLIALIAPQDTAAGHRDAGLEDTAVGPPAARRHRLHQDVLHVLRRYDTASAADRVRQRAGWWRRRRSAAGGATILRLDRLPQMSRRSGTRRWTVRADTERRRQPSHFRGEPA